MRKPLYQQDPLSAALARGDWQLTQRLASLRLESEPNDVFAQFACGIALMELGQLLAAEQHLRRAVALAPAQAEYHAQLARALVLLQRLPEAVRVADAALTLHPRAAQTLDTLGVVYSRANAHERAIELFRHAITVTPRSAAHHYNLAVSLTFSGQIDAAEQAYETLLRLKPRFWRAHTALSQLRRQILERNHITRLNALLANAGDDPAAVVHLNHALAKEYEDLGDYPHAFAHLQAAKVQRRERSGYSIARDRDLFEALIARFLEPLDPPEGAPDEPIFVIGMPRSGTTLVERILSSHPDVHSAGELQNFGVTLKRASGSATRYLLDLDTLARLQDADWPALGTAYLASTRPGTGHTPRFVDKLPHNFMYAGFIARALPRARIICLRRNPLDTCLSNFRQLFGQNTPYYDYSLDLLDTGRYYLLFDRLIAHWRRVLPGRLLEIQYEGLVDDQETQTRRMLDFLGLTWDPACLHHERNTAPVSTASAVQVRAPMHRAGLQRWRHYEPQLSELRALLAAEGVL
jgi:tetratricopeptide (TPR) repeat protein